jgi:hypothetical protein
VCLERSSPSSSATAAARRTLPHRRRSPHPPPPPREELPQLAARHLRPLRKSSEPAGRPSSSSSSLRYRSPIPPQSLTCSVGGVYSGGSCADQSGFLVGTTNRLLLGPPLLASALIPLLALLLGSSAGEWRACPRD